MAVDVDVKLSFLGKGIPQTKIFVSNRRKKLLVNLYSLSRIELSLFQRQLTGIKIELTQTTDTIHWQNPKNQKRTH